MSEIKSAWEIALEKTANVQGDKDKLTEHDTRQEGKVIASKYILEPDNKENDIGEKLKSFTGKKSTWVREGILQTLLSNLTLPKDESEISKTEYLEKAFIQLLKDRKQVSYMMNQLKEFFSQYIQNGEQLKQQLEEQYRPRLQQKIEEISNQIGTQVHLDINADPEFLAALKKNQASLDEQYQEALDQFKEQIKTLFKQFR